MLLVDAAGTLLKVNRHIERIFGFAHSDLEGQSIERLLPLDLRGSHAALRSSYLAKPDVRLMGRGRESRDFASIPFSTYVRSLAANVFYAMGVSPASVELQIEPVSLTVDKAIPCGLILNESLALAIDSSLEAAVPTTT